MNLAFSKYHGAGNDFILMDNRRGEIRLTTDQVALMCHRRYGIGADGLMLVQSSEEADFEMLYFNSDGRVSSFCGNGGRCIAFYALERLGIGSGGQVRFIASDGLHSAELLPEQVIRLSMQKVDPIRNAPDYFILDTGSPHYVRYVEHLQEVDVAEAGRAIRNLPQFREAGINVNFIEQHDGSLHVRTYERGVEEETFACGTGITAAAIASTGVQTGNFSVPVKSKEGHAFEVQFQKSQPDRAEAVYLTGPVNFAFEGIFSLPDAVHS